MYIFYQLQHTDLEDIKKNFSLRSIVHMLWVFLFLHLKKTCLACVFSVLWDVNAIVSHNLYYGQIWNAFFFLLRNSDLAFIAKYKWVGLLAFKPCDEALLKRYIVESGSVIQYVTSFA